MKIYTSPKPEIWTGRSSPQKEYLHEKVHLLDLEAGEMKNTSPSIFALLGYACDEGVKRNQGRVGAAAGPDAIRAQLGKMPNHLRGHTALWDVGNIQCPGTDLEKCQTVLSQTVSRLLAKNVFPILLGGGHDIAYAHYQGIQDHLREMGANKTIGIINFDAHFDLRPNDNGANSGTPFHQISQDCVANDIPFKYLCLGIRRDANNRALFATAGELDVNYVENDWFNLLYREELQQKIHHFGLEVDVLYTTIDLDGFSSAYAPGASAASPMGFSPDIVLECLRTIIASRKLIALDVAELNPTYDRDGQTAKLAASLIHFLIHGLDLVSSSIK